MASCGVPKQTNKLMSQAITLVVIFVKNFALSISALLELAECILSDERRKGRLEGLIPLLLPSAPFSFLFPLFSSSSSSFSFIFQLLLHLSMEFLAVGKGLSPTRPPPDPSLCFLILSISVDNMFLLCCLLT